MRKVNIKKAVGILTAISAIITVLFGLYYFLLPAYLLHKYLPDAKGAASIGIIGGADGPTAIFVSGWSSAWQIIVVSGVIAIAGVAYLILPKLKRQ